MALIAPLVTWAILARDTGGFVSYKPDNCKYNKWSHEFKS